MENLYPEKWRKKHIASCQRQLFDHSDKIDFASNDYLGFAKHKRIEKIIFDHQKELSFQGSTGSRLISGNRHWIEDIENKIASYHHAEAALIFSSAYQANIGLFSCIADRNDLYLIDENVHASIHDGIRLSYAKSFKFRHNDIEHLHELIKKHSPHFDNIFVVVEGLYSMDGDSPNVDKLIKIIDNHKIFLIVDEAHSFGTMGNDFLGLFNDKSIANQCVARIIGYGKALGFSAAAIVGSQVLKNFLINFSRSFIFSTALPLYHYQITLYLYNELIHHSQTQHQQLKKNIDCYLQHVNAFQNFSKNTSPIQYYRIGTTDFNKIQKTINDNNIFAKVILPPTVKKGKERIRISLHSFNTEEEIIHLINILINVS